MLEAGVIIFVRHSFDGGWLEEILGRERVREKGDTRGPVATEGISYNVTSGVQWHQFDNITKHVTALWSLRTIATSIIPE